MQYSCKKYVGHSHTQPMYTREKTRKLTLIGGALANGSAGGKWGRERERGSNKYRRRVYCERECFLSHHNAPWTFQQSKLAHLDWVDLPYIQSSTYHVGLSVNHIFGIFTKFQCGRSIQRNYCSWPFFSFIGDWLLPPLPLSANTARNNHLPYLSLTLSSMCAASWGIAYITINKYLRQRRNHSRRLQISVQRPVLEWGGGGVTLLSRIPTHGPLIFHLKTT